MREAIGILVKRDLVESELGIMMPNFIDAFDVLKSTVSPEFESDTEMFVDDPSARRAMVAWKAEGLHTGHLDGIHATGNQLCVLGVSYLDYSGIDPAELDNLAATATLPIEGIRVVRMIDWASLHAQVGFTLGRQIVPTPTA